MAESLASYNNAKIAQKHKNLPMLVENFAKYEIVNILGNGLRLLKNYRSHLESFYIKKHKYLLKNFFFTNFYHFLPNFKFFTIFYQ